MTNPTPSATVTHIDVVRVRRRMVDGVPPELVDVLFPGQTPEQSAETLHRMSPWA